MATDRSAELAAVGDGARDVLEEKHRAREITLQRVPHARYGPCASAIRAVHRREFLEARELIAEAAAYLAEADAALDGHPDVRYGGVSTTPRRSSQRRTSRSPSSPVSRSRAPRSSASRCSAYLNGMAEAASELRRQVLDCLRRDERDEAERLLGVMDEVSRLLITIDYPDALTGGLRRATDALRGVLERTRGDVTTAIVAARMQRRDRGRSAEARTR